MTDKTLIILDENHLIWEQLIYRIALQFYSIQCAVYSARSVEDVHDMLLKESGKTVIVHFCWDTEEEQRVKRFFKEQAETHHVPITTFVLARKYERGYIGKKLRMIREYLICEDRRTGT